MIDPVEFRHLVRAIEQQAEATRQIAETVAQMISIMGDQEPEEEDTTQYLDGSCIDD